MCVRLLEIFPPHRERDIPPGGISPSPTRQEWWECAVFIQGSPPLGRNKRPPYWAGHISWPTRQGGDHTSLLSHSPSLSFALFFSYLSCPFYLSFHCSFISLFYKHISAKNIKKISSGGINVAFVKNYVRRQESTSPPCLWPKVGFFLERFLYAIQWGRHFANPYVISLF